MSTRVGFLDFDRDVNSWIEAFQAAERDQRATFFHRFRAEMQVMRYLEVHQGKVTIQPHPMLEIFASFRVVKRHEDLVKLDLQTVWGLVAGEDAAMHAFSATDKGFDMLFAVRPGNVYVMSGVMQISSERA
jgi:hypothetical protein